jgi:hypothetical protein
MKFAFLKQSPTIGMNNNCFFAIIDGVSIASLRKIASARD